MKLPNKVELEQEISRFKENIKPEIEELARDIATRVLGKEV